MGEPVGLGRHPAWHPRYHYYQLAPQVTTATKFSSVGLKVTR
jgi:hypothetical protein